MTGSGNGATPPSHAKATTRGRAKETTRAAVLGAIVVDETTFDMPRGFEMRLDGLWRIPVKEKPFRVCGPIEIVAESRPETGDQWGLLLRWHDRDGTAHEWIMPHRLLAGEAVEVRARLAACGLDVSALQGARNALVQFLAAVRVATRVRTVPCTGWHRPPAGGAAFILPDRCIGIVPGEVIRLDIDPMPKVYRVNGSFQGWRETVSPLCEGNSRLLFGISCAFAAPLLPLIGDEGGGFNLFGESSKGKTTIIDAAGSVWGPPSKTGPDAIVRQWRTTGKALEYTLAAHNHILLPLDEMGQADQKELPSSLYMMANGAGKDRSRSGGGNRDLATFKTLILSSSEESTARLADQAGQRIKAGQEMRMLDIPAIVPGGFGCFDELHGESDGNAFAQRLRRGVIAQHGTAAPIFLEYLAGRLLREPDFVAQVLEAQVQVWCAKNGRKGVDGQVQRAARRMALVAVAGELATEAGVTGWMPGAAANAVAVIFRDWLADRGSTGSREEQHLFSSFRHFMGLHGSARFESVREPGEIDELQNEARLTEGQKTIQRAGWRWQELTPEGERFWICGIIPEIFDKEIAGPVGMDGRDARARLGKAKLIREGIEGGKTRWAYRPRRIPGHGQPRLIVVDPAAQDLSMGE